MADIRGVLDDSAARPRDDGRRRASVSRTSRVRYASPAARADSVLSMPPTTVATANGRASGQIRRDLVQRGDPGQRRPRRRQCQRDLGRRDGHLPRPGSHRPQKMTLPASTAANAPGKPHGSRNPPTSVARTRTRETRPTSGSPKTFSDGKNAMSRIATPAIDPSSAARGTTRRTQSPAKARTSFAAPMPTVTPIPIFQARIGSCVSNIAGPRTPNTMPKSDGVSMPKGMAVTSVRPVAASAGRRATYTRDLRRARPRRCPGS